MSNPETHPPAAELGSGSEFLLHPYPCRITWHLLLYDPRNINIHELALFGMTPFLTWAAKGRHPPRRRLRRRPVTSPLTRWGGRAGQSHRVNTFPVLGGIRAQPPAHASAPPTPAAACIAKVLFPRRRHSVSLESGRRVEDAMLYGRGRGGEGIRSRCPCHGRMEEVVTSRNQYGRSDQPRDARWLPHSSSGKRDRNPLQSSPWANQERLGLAGPGGVVCCSGLMELSIRRTTKPGATCSLMPLTAHFASKGTVGYRCSSPRQYQADERCPGSSGHRLEARRSHKDVSTLWAEMPRAGDTEGCKAAGEKPRASNTEGCKAAGEGPRASNTEGYKATGGRVPVTEKAVGADDSEGCTAAGERPRASITEGCKAAGEVPCAKNAEGCKAAGGRVPVSKKAVRRLARGRVPASQKANAEGCKAAGGRVPVSKKAVRRLARVRVPVKKEKQKRERKVGWRNCKAAVWPRASNEKVETRLDAGVSRQYEIGVRNLSQRKGDESDRQGPPTASEAESGPPTQPTTGFAWGRASPPLAGPRRHSAEILWEGGISKQSDTVHLKEAPRSKSSPQNYAPGRKHRRHVEHKEDTEDTFAVSQCATTSLPTTTEKRRTLRFLRVVQAPQVAEKPELQSQSNNNSQGRRLHFEEDGFLFIFRFV
ncbi:hypothetical protein Bbelb_117240 [Branchiostoma belcheri]|nr:hypothetical protein Bbelb_117240 [Branchiostoma belcheri]